MPYQPQHWLLLQVWSFSKSGSPLRLQASATRRGREKRETQSEVFFRAKQQTCIGRNARHIHPWNNVVGGDGVSEWRCTGGLRTVAGRVRIVWMVLDGSKEASLPSRGDKPSLALQQRVTHSIAQWRISGQVLVCFFFTLKNQKVFWILSRRGVLSPRRLNKSNATLAWFLAVYILSHLDHWWFLSRDLPNGNTVS